MTGRKRKKKRTRPRSGKQARRRERDGVSGASPTRIVDEGVEEAQNPVETGSLLTASTAVPTIPTLPPVETRIDDSDPLQSLRSFVGGIIDKVRGFFAGGLSHLEDLEKRVIARLDHISEIRAQAIKEKDLKKSKRFGAASARLEEYLHKLQTTDAN